MRRRGLQPILDWTVRTYGKVINHLWVAVLLDRLGVTDYTKPGRLPGLGLIKLRDLPGNFWNADTLFILTKKPEQARRWGIYIGNAFASIGSSAAFRDVVIGHPGC